MNLKLTRIVLSTLLIVGLLSCKEEENANPNNPINEISQDLENGKRLIKLSKKLENPYSVNNMRKAFENVQARLTQTVNVRTTHLYVKFKPKTELELDLLKKDSTLIVYEYPLDYELAPGGTYYHDPEVPVDQPTYQYAAVKVNYNFPSVAYEVLSELYLPEDDIQISSNQRIASSGSVDLLLQEAFKITGNEAGYTPKKSRSNARFNPRGTITVWDGIVGRFVPVVGAKVHAKRWFKSETGYTDANGEYTISSFAADKVNFSIIWERADYSIRTGTFGQAILNGPTTSNETWNVNLGSSIIVGTDDVVGNDQQYFALIHQGAHDYYYGNRFGLSSPPRNGTLTPQTKISADYAGRSATKDSHTAEYARTGGLLPSIYIRMWNDPADEVYAVTTHELAHAAHWEMNRDNFRLLIASYPFPNTGSERLVESWANGVEWQFAIQRYINLFGIIGYEYNANYQTQSIAGFPFYTSLVVDMNDNINQRNVFGAPFPQDNVSGYTILQMEQGIRGATSWANWRDNMINIHDNPTEGFLRELYANW